MKKINAIFAGVSALLLLCQCDRQQLPGEVSVSANEGITSNISIQQIDSANYIITADFTAQRDVDSVRLELDLTMPYHTDYWMIPAVSYNGNHWGKGKEPKGADIDGEWRTLSYRRTPIPGAIYSEGADLAVATWSKVPNDSTEDFALSIHPMDSCTVHCLIWPEEEMPQRYASRDLFALGTRRIVRMAKGETHQIVMYVNVGRMQANHKGYQQMLRQYWQTCEHPKVEVPDLETLWDRGISYTKGPLWAEEKEFRGFRIGLNWDEAKQQWNQCRGYEAGWCGQNISLANSLLFNYLWKGDEESKAKGLAALDCWAHGAQYPNGLFASNYMQVLDHDTAAVIDACNLGTVVPNLYEAYDLAKKAGEDRPEYKAVARRICDFVISDQQPDGCYAKGWKVDGSCFYRDGTVGCFLVPAMLATYRDCGDSIYMKSALHAYDHYIQGLHQDGFTTAGALDTWCIDKESSIALLRSALQLYALTQEQQYLADAVDVSYYLSTWLWHYTEVYPADDDFTRYGYQTFGGTSVSVQHNHIDHYALYWVPEWRELSRLTGDPQWAEKADAIWANGSQLVSDGTLEVNGYLRPEGSQNEAYFESEWGFGWNEGHRINQWLVAWPNAFRLEVMRKLGQ